MHLAAGREGILLASIGPEDDCEECLEQEPDAQEEDDYLSHPCLDREELKLLHHKHMQL